MSIRLNRAILFGFAFCLVACDSNKTEFKHHSDWTPKWENAPQPGSRTKARLNPTVAFTEERLGSVPVPGTDEEKRKDKEHQAFQQSFVRAFQTVLECKRVTLLRTDPKSADFDWQLFEGIDGRVGRMQWVLYRTDSEERLDFGETSDVKTLAKEICLATRTNVELVGGTIR